MGKWAYRAFKAYYKLLNDHLLYRKVYSVGTERIPGEGERIVLVSNHQNNANDALGLILLLGGRRYPTIFTSGVFMEKVPWLRWFFDGIGLLPAYRADYEGLEHVDKNAASMDEMKRRLMEGRPVIIYPEGTGQFGRYLGRFIPNYLHLAFQAAETEGWKTDIKVVPTANHYNDYFDVQGEFMISVGEPVSLKPYYERYRQKPRTTVREINEVLHQRVKDMMLHVEDREHYDAIDFLRGSAFGDQYAGKGLTLPERLQKDREMVAMMERKDDKQLYADALRLKQAEEKYALCDEWVDEHAGWMQTLVEGGLQLLLMPLWVVSLWPHLFLYWLPTLLLGENRMYANTYRALLNSLLVFPLSVLVTLAVVGGIYGQWVISLIWIFIWFLSARFAWWMWMRIKRTRGRLFLLTHPSARKEIEEIRQRIAGKWLEYGRK